MRRHSFFMRFFSFAVCLLITAGVVSSVFNGVRAGGYMNVHNAVQMMQALEHPLVDTIYVDESFTIKCPSATTGNTAYFLIDRNIKIIGKTPDVTITREAADGADVESLQSIFGICGNGHYGGIVATFRDITLDGGADFGNKKGLDRVSMTASQAGVGGRSIIDVYKRATLTLDYGVTVQNGFCTNSLPSMNSFKTAKYGGGVRVDCDDTNGGGIVNLKHGACIKNCVAQGATSGYGGGIGGYSFSWINICGGNIEDCSAYYGGAVACTYKTGDSKFEAGRFEMYSGTIKNCSANQGGAISADGDHNVENCLYGGTIENCSASVNGSAVGLGGLNGEDGFPGLSLAPYSSNGPLIVKDCVSRTGDTDPDTQYGGKKLKYKAMYLGGSSSPVTIEGFLRTVSFKKFKEDTGYFYKATVKNGMQLSDSFPYSPSSDIYRFIEWNTVYDGSGTKITSTTHIDNNLIVYARWYKPPELIESDDIKMRYGENNKFISVSGVETPYGGDVYYQWYENKYINGQWSLVSIDGANSAIYTIPRIDKGLHFFVCRVKIDVGGTYAQTIDSNSIDVEVIQKLVNVKWSSDSEFVYDGKAKVPKAVLEGVFEGDDCTVEVTGAKTDPGTYIASARLVGKDADKYELSAGTDSKIFTINPAPTGKPTAVPTKTAEPTKPGSPTAKPSASPTKAVSATLTLDKKSIDVVCGNKAVVKATLKGAKGNITWKSSNGNIASVDSEGKITAKQAGQVTITATAAGKSATCTVQVLFKDVTNSKDFWYVPTYYLVNKDVVKGYDKQTLFKPANVCTRAQMVTFIWRLKGEPAPKAKTCKFKDVKKTDYFYKACIWGNENHIVEGYKNGTFGPQIVCARKHAVTFLWRLANKPNPSSKTNKFKDVKKSDYFYTATLWASEKGILAGYSDGTFRPDGDCLRRQMVTFLYKYDKFVEK